MVKRFTYNGVVKADFGKRLYNKLSLPRYFYQGLKGNELLVYLVLYDNAQESTAKIRISQSTISALTGIGERTVREVVKSLKDKKLIKELNKGKKYRGVSVGTLYEVYQWENISSKLVKS